MRRTIFYIVDLILLDFGIVIGYYARKVKDWFKLMEEELEESDKSEHDFYEGAFRKENDLYD